MGAARSRIKQHDSFLTPLCSFSAPTRNRRGRPGRSSGRWSSRRPKALRLERLEERFFLTAGSLLPAVSPVWFEDVADAGAAWHAGSPSLSSDCVDWSDEAASSALGEEDVFDWIVRFNTKSVEEINSVSETASLLVGGGLEFEVLRGLGLTGQVLVRSSGASSDSVAGWLTGNTCVASYEIDAVQQFQLSPNDSQYTSLWGLENTGQTGGTPDADIDASAAWDISTGSSNIVVGVIDTGVDYTHPDLAANAWINPGETAGNGIDDDGNGFIDDVHGYDFINNDGDPMDDHSHGTHVAGTIAAAGNNGQGVTGVNWSSSIMGLKFLSAGGSGYTSDAVRAVNYATMMRTSYGVNVRVTNNSWGGGGYSSALDDAIGASGDAGILFVAAAGNNGANNDAYPHYPSNYDLPNVLSVAATDHNDNLAYFSNYGASSVHLAAPGVSVYSTVPGAGYASYSGTSMATPHVAGVAALAWSVAPDASVAEVRAALLQGTDSLAALDGKVTTGGRLNALGAVQFLVSDGPRVPIVSSLSASPNFITAGTATTLTAQGVIDLDGTVTSVSFYEDSNADGQFDVGDQLIGTDSTVVDSEAGITLQTTGLAAGPHAYFARALDDDGQWGAATRGTLTIVPPDDHGNDAATATSVEVGSTVDGMVERGGDIDWFAFEAVAGTSYVFQTVLVDLPDSVLSLYDQDGSTLIDYNDDISWPDHPNSQIVWTAGAGGTYYLAVAAYSGSQVGEYQLQLQTVVDDHGDSAATATAAAVGNSVDGEIQFAADEDWFAFEATAGGRYILQTELVDLPDSVLSLYDRDGSTLIDYNDDISWPDDPASRIDWTAETSGTYYLAVDSWDDAQVGAYRLHLELVNHVPLLEPIADQTIGFEQAAVEVVLTATDGDGEPLTLSAAILPSGPFAQLAYDLDQQLGLERHSSGYLEDLFGEGEKFMVGDAGWFFILPNGELYAWRGSIEASELVATLDASYHADPTLLHDALRPAVREGEVTLSLQGDRLTIDPADGYVGTFQVQITVSDGTDSTVDTFQVRREAPPSTDLGTIDSRQISALDLTGGELLYVLETGHAGWLTLEAAYEGAPADVTLTLYDEHFRQLTTGTDTTAGERIDWSVAAGEIYFFGLAGDNADVDLRLANLVHHSGSNVTVHGTAGSDTLRFSAGDVHELRINGFLYQFQSGDVSAITFDGGGGNDLAVLTGSAENDVAVMSPDSTALYGSGYQVVVSGAPRTVVRGGGGSDRVYMYDSAGNDTFIGTSDFAEFYGNGFYTLARNFGVVVARTTAGGNDRAVFKDSAGNDTFVGTPTYAELYGNGSYTLARNFEVVVARATAGGSDRAVFKDSAGNDTFVGTPTYSELYGNGSYTLAKNFEVVSARATAGGNDLAVFKDSAGNDTFVGTPTYAELYGSGFYNFARGFDRVHARATAGGNDRAVLYDSAGNDMLTASGAYAEFYGNGFYNYARGFDRVQAFATRGGSDVKHVRAVDYVLATYGNRWRRS
ncbi:MAG: S8 family serine peptidase [Planctomycetota bacterium]|jgi:subtilisin family serine protease